MIQGKRIPMTARAITTTGTSALTKKTMGTTVTTATRQRCEKLCCLIAPVEAALMLLFLINTPFIQYLNTNPIANQTPRTTIAIILRLMMNKAKAPGIRLLEGLVKAVNHGVAVMKQAIILPFVISLAHVPRIQSTWVQIRGPQSERVLNKICSDA